MAEWLVDLVRGAASCARGRQHACAWGLVLLAVVFNATTSMAMQVEGTVTPAGLTAWMRVGVGCIAAGVAWLSRHRERQAKAEAASGHPCRPDAGCPRRNC